MKIICAGSRKFDDYEVLKTNIDNFILKLDCKGDTTIISGTAKGADKLGEKYATEKGLTSVLFPANWDKYGKRAGPIRNLQMAEYADAAIIFWDGSKNKSGTWDMICKATSYKLILEVVFFVNDKLTQKSLF